VNVHVGGIVRTRDAGETWEPTIDICTDVHEVWAGEPVVFAACALGPCPVSEDRGDSWCIEDEGLHATPELVAFGTPQGRVFASQDEGSSWDEVARGLPPIECLLVTP